LTTTGHTKKCPNKFFTLTNLHKQKNKKHYLKTGLSFSFAIMGAAADMPPCGCGPYVLSMMQWKLGRAWRQGE